MKFKLIVAASVLLFASACSTVQQYAEKGVDIAKEAHDQQLVAGEVLLCGSSLRSFLERYASDPEKLNAVITVCGYNNYFNLIRSRDGN